MEYNKGYGECYFSWRFKAQNSKKISFFSLFPFLSHFLSLEASDVCFK
jgi:hypothetical protein